MAGEIQWFEGADAGARESYSTIPEEPRFSQGPLETSDGVDVGRSFGVPDSPSNAVDSPSGGSGSVISGPMDD